MVTVQGLEREDLYNKMTINNLIPRAGTADEVAQGILFVIKNNSVFERTQFLIGVAPVSALIILPSLRLFTIITASEVPSGKFII